MNKAKIAQFTHMLEEEKKTLEAELNSLGKQTGPDGEWTAALPEQDGNEPEHIDQADHVVEYESRVATLKNLETRYNEVVAALKRVEDGTYGKDVVTGKLIDEKRLEANPAAAGNI